MAGMPGWAWGAVIEPPSQVLGLAVDWLDVGAGGLVALAIISIFRGWLVPGREMRYWREAFFEEQRQKRELMETGRVTQQVLQSVDKAIEAGDSS